jgi:RimJ/RimL family protein N-acetyltransferase
VTLGTDIIQTERLLLRPLRPSDTEPLLAQFANWEVVRWLGTPPWPYTRDDARSFVALQLGRPPIATGYLAITLGDSLIGAVEASSRGEGESAASLRSPTLGYWLAQPHWGRGYMTEAGGAYIARIFAQTTIDTIYSGAFAGNEASLRVQDKLGFERTGEAQVYCRPHGEKRPHVNTQLTRSQHLARST